MLLAALVALAALFLSGAPALAQEGPATTVRGVITSPTRDPLPDVEVSVTNETEVVDSAGATLAPGAFTGDSKTNAEGEWEVTLPGGGTYTVTLDEKTLPEGVVLADAERTSLSVNVLPESSKGVLFRTVSADGSGGSGQASTFDRFLQLTVDGLVFGLVIALAAIGLSLVYGTTQLTNFSHGELVTLGALSAYFFSSIVGLPFILAAALSVVVCGILGGIQDGLLWRRLRKRGTGLIAMLVISIGFGILLRYIYLFFFGGSTRQFNSYVGQAGVNIGPILITPKAMIGSLIAIFFLLLAAFWLLKTKNGKASRAIADNPALASASGIDVERVINRVWIYGAGLAALSGILYSLSTGVSWLEGYQLLLLIFAGVTVGGLGTAFGAMVGSLIVGVLIQVSTLVVPPELKNVGALVILIVILMVRPQGILGRRERVG